jgi:hypothetical protein
MSDFRLNDAPLSTEVTVQPLSPAAAALVHARIGAGVVSFQIANEPAAIAKFCGELELRGYSFEDARTVSSCGIPLKNETWTRPLGVGDRVRSYDFEGRKDFYAEGSIVDFRYDADGCRRYAIQVSAKVEAGVSVPVRAGFVYPPVNGTPKCFGGVCSGVERI